jgi:thymidylate kinase
MITVALIGPDGVGKTTIGRELEETLSVPMKYMYMGINLESSNCLSPISRLQRRVRKLCGVKPDAAGPRDPDKPGTQPKGPIRRTLQAGKSTVSLALRIFDEWYRQAAAWFYQLRGYVVLFDRHYFCDYYSYDIVSDGRPRPLLSRLHGWMLSKLYPKPDLVICLDAPGEVLYARKQESTPELLERRRRDYLQMSDIFKHFRVVDANRAADKVADAVARHILAFHRLQTRKSARRLGT